MHRILGIPINKNPFQNIYAAWSLCMPSLSQSPREPWIHAFECGHWVVPFLLAGGTEQLQPHLNLPDGTWCRERLAQEQTSHNRSHHRSVPLPATCHCHASAPCYSQGDTTNPGDRGRREVYGMLRLIMEPRKKWMALSHLSLLSKQ